MSAALPVADIYIRESTEELAAGFSPDEMIRVCRDKAAQLGALVDRVIVEAGKRDEYDCPRLVEEIERARLGQIDYLISWDMARLSGDLGKHLWVKSEIRKTRVELHYATVEFAQTAEGDMFETFMGAYNTYERTKIRARTQNGVKGKLAREVPVGGGVTAYGLEKLYDEKKRVCGYAPREGQIEILRGIVKAAQTQTLREIADGLNDQGIPSPGDARWKPATVHKLIANPIYDGQYLFGRKKYEPKRRANGDRWWKPVKNDPSHVQTIAIDQIVDAADLAAARAALNERKVRRRARCDEQDDPFTLRGRLFCLYCGGALSAYPKKAGRRYYRCLRAFPSSKTNERSERCPLPLLPAESIERHAWDGLSARLADREGFAAELEQAADGGEILKRYQQQVADLKGRIEKLSRRLANGANQMRDYDVESDTYQTLKAGQQADERTKSTLVENLASLEQQRPVVFGPEQVAAALDARDRLLAGLVEAGTLPIAQRTLYRTLGTCGVVGLDPDGVQLGRIHRWAIEWATPGDRGHSVANAWAFGTLLVLTPDYFGLRFDRLAATG